MNKIQRFGVIDKYGRFWRSQYTCLTLDGPGRVWSHRSNKFVERKANPVLNPEHPIIFNTSLTADNKMYTLEDQQLLNISKSPIYQIKQFVRDFENIFAVTIDGIVIKVHTKNREHDIILSEPVEIFHDIKHLINGTIHYIDNGRRILIVDYENNWIEIDDRGKIITNHNLPTSISKIVQPSNINDPGYVITSENVINFKPVTPIGGRSKSWYQFQTLDLPPDAKEVVDIIGLQDPGSGDRYHMALMIDDHGKLHRYWNDLKKGGSPFGYRYIDDEMINSHCWKKFLNIFGQYEVGLVNEEGEVHVINTDFNTQLANIPTELFIDTPYQSELAMKKE